MPHFERNNFVAEGILRNVQYLPGMYLRSTYLMGLQSLGIHACRKYTYGPNKISTLARSTFPFHNIKETVSKNITDLLHREDRLCDLVVRVPGHRSRVLGFDSRRYQIFWEAVGLERGSLNVVSTTEELFAAMA
jgi:hypothetical protein